MTQYMDHQSAAKDYFRMAGEATSLDVAQAYQKAGEDELKRADAAWNNKERVKAKQNFRKHAPVTGRTSRWYRHHKRF